MKSRELWNYIQDLRDTNSRNEKRRIVGDVLSEGDDVGHAIALLAGDVTTPDDSIGVGKKTVRKALTASYDAGHDVIREHEKELGNLTEVPLQLERPNRLMDDSSESSVEDLIDMIKDLTSTDSDKQKISILTTNLNESENPQMAVYAALCERRDYSIGVSWKTVRDACAQVFDVTTDEVERAYGIGTEIGTIAETLSREFGINGGLKPLDRVRPMLASSRDIPDDTSGWVADTKYDGGRLLVHQEISREGIISRMAQTRKRRDIIGNLPEIGEVDWPDVDFIVDAEAVGYDPDTGETLPFQKFMERFQREKNIEEKSEEVAIDFRLFDLLYWEDEDLTEFDYEARRSILNVHFPEDLVATAYNDLDKAFETATRMGFEGIIAKKLDHTYEFQRSNSWRKLKPTKESIELRITDVIRGTGRLSGTLGALRVETAGGVALGKVGTGFTDADRNQLWESHDLVGDIVELEWEELQERDGEYGLRFPRYLGLRPEGSPDSLDRIKGL